MVLASAFLVLISPHDIRSAWAPIVLALIGVGGVLVPNQVVTTVITFQPIMSSSKKPLSSAFRSLLYLSLYNDCIRGSSLYCDRVYGDIFEYLDNHVAVVL